ncbi:MAG: ATP-binding cassette domain-containing protein [Candidatus Aminicenantes bacterium]|nr:ATP-binding cassette domain-containing protein [Candidatus Aminicenantes bacterium]NIM77953.1 ATP-binding cassette domain-containing protein [Candidatus Aminicenantes bacterium]NIN17282.1 ATP-binding cassette domain-containing protein [Candidatus Aminicenantes bacterium]NIN41173.1 ATP-binding cassette domain-containing protein [Candidatus Aminicenantes bacterium]NIN83950.1 ATP-binding cassette domain-containing protein [Candidatus Aminicenantes bacterium]
MAEEKKKLVELQAVTAGYNGHIVLENINLTIYKQDFLGIIGANGSGKTTLIKVLLGLIKPMRGAIRFYFESSDKPGKHIGYLPQGTMFDKKFPITVQDIVLSGLVSKVGVFKSFCKEDKAAADRVLEQMGILDLKHRAIGTLSGGQMQRVYLARALVSSPALLVLDEPDTFVDQTFTRAFYEILEELNSRIAIILVSHDLGMISSQVKAIACVCRTLHYHNSNIITNKLLDSYNCPIDLITHGDLPHRVLEKHGDEKETPGVPHA